MEPLEDECGHCQDYPNLWVSEGSGKTHETSLPHEKFKSDPIDIEGCFSLPALPCYLGKQEGIFRTRIWMPIDN